MGEEIEIRADPAAYRRHRFGMILFAWSIGLYFPVAGLILVILNAVARRASGDSLSGPVFLGGLAILGFIWLFGCRDAVSYRCPLCRRRLPRAIRVDRDQPALCYDCDRCRIVWDLGWHFEPGGGVGG